MRWNQLSDAELRARLVQRGLLSPDAADIAVRARETEVGRAAIAVLLEEDE